MTQPKSILNNRRPVGVAFTADEVTITLSDGSKVSTPLSWHPWLEAATPEQRTQYKLYRYSVDFLELDDGLDIEAILRGEEDA